MGLTNSGELKGDTSVTSETPSSSIKAPDALVSECRRLLLVGGGDFAGEEEKLEDEVRARRKDAGESLDLEPPLDLSV